MFVTFNIKEGYIDFGGEIIELIPGRRFNDLNVVSPDKTENANDQTIDDKLSVEQQLEYPNQIPPEKIADPLSLIEVPWDDFNQDEQALIRQCLERNRETFFDGQMKSLGQTSILDPIIETIPHKPFVKRPYHVPPQLIDKVYTTITDMLEAGIIEVSTDSPYLSPALWIEKPNKDDGEPYTEPDEEGEQHRPHGLRPKPRRRSFGDDFVTDLDQLRVMKSQNSWKTYM